MKPPFFIVGSGRAGTTLLSTILNASGQVFVPPESDFVARAYPYFRDHREFSYEEYRCIAALFRICSQQDGWGMSAASIVSALEATQPCSFAEVNTCIYNAYLSAKGMTGIRWGIKRPVLIASLDRIRSVFPNALIVHIVRDGRDVYASYKDVRNKGFRWGPSGVVATALYWVDAVRRVPSRPLPHILEIRYEDLVVAPERMTQQVCNFLEVEYKREMIRDFSRTAATRSIISSSHRRTIHGKIFSNIDSKNINKYERSLGSTEKSAFTILAAPLLDRYGYSHRLGPFMAFAMKIYLPLIYSCGRVFNDVRYRYRDSKQYNRALRSVRKQKGSICGR